MYKTDNLYISNDVQLVKLTHVDNEFISYLYHQSGTGSGFTFNRKFVKENLVPIENFNEIDILLRGLDYPIEFKQYD